ncbi:MAG: hypothetical protein VZS44_10320 [Bacilli bacterium]|nr:hypothetical protein [Bacilli bacterium]
MKQYEKENKNCIYCKKPLSDNEINNANDFGLHAIAKGSSTCSACDSITLINRNLKRMVDNPTRKEECIQNIRYILNNMEGNK